MVLMKLFVSLITFLYANMAFGACKPTVVAVLDTGFGFEGRGHEAKLCKFGHKDFSIDKRYSAQYGTKDKIPLDIHGHGTNIVGVISDNTKITSYCFVIVKYYSDMQSSQQNLAASTKAIQYANSIGADFINYSGGGPVLDEQEQRAVKTFLSRGGKFVAAAGNEKEDLDSPENGYYPAMDDIRVISVGNNNFYGVRSYTSNYGKRITRWEKGENVTGYGITMTGTSQATAVATGKILSERKNKCDIGFQWQTE